MPVPTYSFLFTVDCSGHITCTVTNGGDGSNTASMGCCSVRNVYNSF